MKITVCSSKGGVGKTRISLNLALALECAIITNDINTLSLRSIFDKKRYMILQKEQSLKILPSDYDIIFDFGGFVDSRMATAIEQSDWVLIPTVHSEDGDSIQATLDIIAEIEKINQNIVVIASRTKTRGDFEFIEKAICKYYNNEDKTCKYKVFEIKESKALQNLTKEKKSIRATVEEGGIKAYQYRKIVKQFDNLIQYIS